MVWARLPGRSSVPVLCYHNTGGNGVPWKTFEAQMRWLKDADVATLSQAALRRFLNGEFRSYPGVFLTFDDGFRDLYTHVGPLFAELGFNATVFIINNRMRPSSEPGACGEIIGHRAHEAFLRRGDRSAWLSWAELRELIEDGIMEVGSHSSTHAKRPVSPPELTEISDHWSYAPWTGKPGAMVPRLAPELAGPLWLEEQGRLESEKEMYFRVVDDLSKSRKELEWRLGTRIRSLAWPWGRSHPVAIRAAHDAGLDMMFTLDRGCVGRDMPMDDICRVEVRRNKGLNWFKSRVALYSRAWTARLYSATRM